MKQDKKWKGNTPQERAVSIIKGFINQVDTIHIEKAVEEMDDQELFSQQPTVIVDDFGGILKQSDSVDAESLHDIFYKKYLSYMEHEPEGCMKKAFIETVLSSKVKPVNEITEALNNIKSDLEADISLSDEASPFVKDAIEKINTLLSTAPDDGWISVEKELPKEVTHPLTAYLVYIENEGKYPNIYTKRATWDGKEWTHSSGERLEHVTHWQPLPKSPR